MKVRSLTRFVLPFLISSPFNFIQADETAGAPYGDNFLIGDWGGARTSLADKGYEFEFIYTQDFYYLDYSDDNLLAQKRTVYLNNSDITMTIDAEKAWGLGGATFFFYVLGTGGDNPSDFVGDVQTFNNIDSPDAWKLHEIWYQQSFLDDKYSMLFGLYDLNSEFDVTETAGLFSGSSHGIGPDFSQSGAAGPSIFPVVSLALRGLVNVTDQTYLQGVVLDGVPGDPNDPNKRNANITLDSTDGVLMNVEIGHVSKDDDRFHKFALGFWGYSKGKFDKETGLAEDTKNQGAYASADGMIFQEGNDSTQGLNAFIRYGFAEDKVNDVKTYNGGGLVYTGLFPGRDEDQFGLGIAIANPTNSFKSANPAADSETAIELSYFMQISPWFAIKPDVQWITHPGMFNSKPDATVIGVRMELSL
ncbi:MAG: carbohydrate porin [Thiohalomonadales bacterium]